MAAFAVRPGILKDLMVDPQWSTKAEACKSFDELQQVFVDFAAAKGFKVGQVGLQVDAPEVAHGLKDVATVNSQTPNRRLVYVKYKDHVFYKNMKKHPSKAVIRETVGWIRNENEELLLLESDRCPLPGSTGFNGVAILKNCIIEQADLPLENIFGAYLEPNISKQPLNRKGTEVNVECALQPKKRKTHRGT